MYTHQFFKSELVVAMKAKDASKLRTIRSLLTAFTNELVATGKTPQDMLDDEHVITVIRRLAKQRKDSITQFEAAGRNDLSEPEKEELTVLESYLPRMMSKEELRPIIEQKIASLGEEAGQKVGMLIGSLMKELTGKAEGGDVKALVDEILKK